MEERIMYDFEMHVKQATERHEALVQELHVVRQLPRKAQEHFLTRVIAMLTAALATKPTQARPA
jgi:hypothetical protein